MKHTTENTNYSMRDYGDYPDGSGRTKPALILMVGGPGAGKSYTRSKRYGFLPFVCADAIKATHPDYDPKDPSAVHIWSTQIAVQQCLTKCGAGETFVYDSTGTNLERMLTIINAARAAGHDIHAVLVACPLATALRRNAERERTIDADAVRAIHANVAESWVVLQGMVDTTEIIDNG